MKSQIASRKVFQRILYSQAWEDPQVDIEGCKMGPESDVLAIGAAGDNALAFLLTGAKSVTAIDFNPNQNHLLELKLSAIESLEPLEVQGFLGARPSSSRAFFYRQVRGLLSPAAQAFWDEQPDLIERGVIHVGRFDGYLRTFATWLLPLIHRKKVVRGLFECRTLEEQKEHYRKHWDTWRWRTVFRVFFGKKVMGRLGRDPAFFKHVDIDRVGEEFRRRCERALTEIPVQDNWFLDYMAFGEYSDPDRRLPIYLRPENHAALRAVRPRLKLVVGSFEEYLPTQKDGTFSAFYLSDIFEWMAEDAFVTLLKELVRTGRPGGRLTWRNLLVKRGHPQQLDGLLEHEAELSRQLHARDRSWVYGDFVVDRIR